MIVAYNKEPNSTFRVKTIRHSFDFSSKVACDLNPEDPKCDPLYRVVDKQGRDLNVLPVPLAVLEFLEQFFQSFLFRQRDFNWNINIFRSRLLISRILEKSFAKEESGSKLYTYREQLSRCPIECNSCESDFPCLLCQHTIGCFEQLIKAEYSETKAHFVLSKTKLPAVARPWVIEFLLGSSLVGELVVDASIHQIVHVHSRGFAPEIRSRITREVFVVWANAFIEGRLGQFQQTLYNLESLDFPNLPIEQVNGLLEKQGSFPDYETYLLLPENLYKDPAYCNRPNIDSEDRLFTPLDFLEIKESRQGFITPFFI